MQEKTIEKHLITSIRKACGGLALKFTSAYFTGMPDRMVLLPGGKLCFVELKAPGERPTAKQEATHRMLRNLGFGVYILDSIESVRQFVEEVTPSDFQAL